MSENPHPGDEHLYEYLDAELMPEQAAAVEAHLANCPGCARRLDEIRAVFLALEELPELALERDLAQGVQGAIAPTQAPAWRSLWPLSAVQLAVSAAVLLFAWPLVSRWLPLEAVLRLSGRVEEALLAEAAARWQAALAEASATAFSQQAQQIPLRAFQEAASAWLAGWQALQSTLLAWMGQASGGWERLGGGASHAPISTAGTVVLLFVATVLWVIGNGVLLRPRNSENRRI